MYKSIGVRKHSTSENGKHLGKECSGDCAREWQEKRLRATKASLGRARYSTEDQTLSPSHGFMGEPVALTVRLL